MRPLLDSLRRSLSQPAGTFQLDLEPQLEQLITQPGGFQWLPAGPPKRTYTPILQINTAAIDPSLVGRYDSPTRQEWEDGVFTAVLTDETLNLRPIIASIRHEHAGSARGCITLHIQQSLPQALTRATKLEREGLVLGGHTLPVQFLTERQAPGTVRVMLMDLPPEYAVQGVTEAILSCAGYECSSSMVVHEFAGAIKVDGVIVNGVGRSDRLVAYVRPPADDPFLSKLPEAYTFPRGPRTVFTVDGRQSVPRHYQVPAAVAAERATRIPPPPPPPRPRATAGGPSGRPFQPPGVPGAAPRSAWEELADRDAARGIDLAAIMAAHTAQQAARAGAGVSSMQVEEGRAHERVAPAHAPPPPASFTTPSPMDVVVEPPAPAEPPAMTSLTEWPPLSSPSTHQPTSRIAAGRSGNARTRKSKQQQQQKVVQQPQQQQPQQQQSEVSGAPASLPGPAWVAQLSSTTSVHTQCGIWLHHSLLASFVKQVLEEDYLEEGVDPLPTLRLFFQTHRESILLDECTVGESGLPINIPTTKTDLPSVTCVPYVPQPS